MPPRRYMLHEANYRQLLDRRPNLAVLPWGAVEAHNYHLPHGTDNAQVSALAEQAATLADKAGARVVVLPTIPVGNDEMQLDGQVATLSFTTRTMGLILDDIVRSLVRQGIDRLLLINGHGGNEFRPLIRDVQNRYPVVIVLVDWWGLCPEQLQATYTHRGDHAGEMETSLMLHLHPDWVVMDQAGDGATVDYDVHGLKQPGVWTPRIWRLVHPDTGCGDPAQATAEKGRTHLEYIARALSELMVNISAARPGDLPCPPHPLHR